ncbi:hypothetical protein HQN89_10875 [Paenibacillus frigoriresistens]|uniref:hypothetical protein n=1 Tax=Paenibacillus alginolyticus TaxID=59839 RepID=UPI001565BB8A|nr:hypothetical protein [Paenibacillus frigoriresistens]NRF91522.1 hypothetical protein [Paenibacillus frigoriresistens]
MPYTKTTWLDKVVQYPMRFFKSGETSGGVTLSPDNGTVTQAGTPINAANMNKIENALESVIGKDNTTIVETTSIRLETDTRTVQLTYTSGVLTKIEEKNGSTVIKTTNLIYTSGTLTSVTEVANGRTVTTTLNYVSGTLDNLTKGVV